MRKMARLGGLFLLLTVLAVVLGCFRARIPSTAYLPLAMGTPEEVGINPAAFNEMDSIIQEAIDKNATPGGVLIVGRNNKIVYEKAYGNRRQRPFVEQMTVDTIFDLASCSKVLGTSVMTMLLIQDGKLSLNTKVADILPEFAQNEKGDVTVRNLLTHTSGLAPYFDWKEAEKIRGDKTTDQALFSYIASMKKRYTTGENYIYSCLNFLTLARLNETVAGESMQSFLKRRVWNPLGMKSSGYLLTPEQLARTATTAEKDSMMVGIVHDPLAKYYKATEAHCPGNAGLFMSAGDMAIISQLVLNGGMYNNVRVFNSETVKLWTSPNVLVPEYDAKKADHRGDMVQRALGWGSYQDPPYVSPKAPKGSFIGHTGWTGTYIWVDKNSKSFIVFDTNCVHSNPDPQINPYRKRIVATLLKSLDLYAEKDAK